MHATSTLSHDGLRRLAEEKPAWIPVVRACLTLADRTGDDGFAGAWVLSELRRENWSGMGLSGRPSPWLPNLKALVTYGILVHRDTTRGGRRAYYTMPQREFVRATLDELSRSQLTPDARREAEEPDLMPGSVQQANIRLVPTRVNAAALSLRTKDGAVILAGDMRDLVGRADLPHAFPEGLEDFFLFLRANLRSGLSVEIEPPEQNAELGLHFDVLFVPTLVVSCAAWPFVVDLAATWVGQRLFRQAPRTTVRSEYTVIDTDGGTRTFRYEGPAEAYAATIKQVIHDEQNRRAGK